MPSLFFENKNDWFPSTRSLRGALNANSAISSRTRMKESSDLMAHAGTMPHMHTDRNHGSWYH